jgi:hypothetical protein
MLMLRRHLYAPALLALLVVAPPSGAPAARAGTIEINFSSLAGLANQTITSATIDGFTISDQVGFLVVAPEPAYGDVVGLMPLPGPAWTLTDNTSLPIDGDGSGQPPFAVVLWSFAESTSYDLALYGNVGNYVLWVQEQSGMFGLPDTPSYAAGPLGAPPVETVGVANLGGMDYFFTEIDVVTAQAVPEPPAALLLEVGIGGVSLAHAVRRIRKRPLHRSPAGHD